MTKLLTALAVKNLKPRARRYSVPVGGARNLHVDVTPSGHKSWAVFFRMKGDPKLRKLTIDHIPITALAEARQAAAAAWVEIERGVNPAAKKRQAKATKAAAVTVTGDTVERYVAQFIRDHVDKKTGAANQVQARHVFGDMVLPRWRGRPMGSITRKHVRELLRDIAADRPVMANRAQSHISKFFKWALAEDIIEVSPAFGVERPTREVARDRMLSDDEIRSLWKATGTLPQPFGAIYRLLLLSGCRRQEIGEMRWTELDLTNRTFTIPATRSKAKTVTVLPLGPMAWEIIEAQPRILDVDYVWGRRRSGFAHIKDRLDELMKTASDWRTHDIRRTSRSLMSRAGVQPDVAERAIGHSVGTVVSRTYDRFEYLNEKRACFATLERLIGTIINTSEDNVVTLRR